MEELQPQDIEDLLQELEEEDSAQESLPPGVEELLHLLQSARSSLDRRDAAVRLGRVESSSFQVQDETSGNKWYTASLVLAPAAGTSDKE